MARTQTMVQLTDELVEALDEEAEHRRASRSAVIRLAVEQFLAQEGQRGTTRRIVEGYRRVPPGEPDEWGALDDATARSTGELLQRLDAEERAGGLPPW